MGKRFTNAFAWADDTLGETVATLGFLCPVPHFTAACTTMCSIAHSCLYLQP